MNCSSCGLAHSLPRAPCADGCQGAESSPSCRLAQRAAAQGWNVSKNGCLPSGICHSNFSLVLTAQYIQDIYIHSSKWKDKRLCLMAGCSSYFVGAIGNLLFLSTLFDVLLSLRHWINSSSQPLHTESTLDTIFCGRWWSESGVCLKEHALLLSKVIFFKNSCVC